MTQEKPPCRFASASSEAYVIPLSGIHYGKEQKVEKPERDLCTWASYHVTAPDKLVNTPPWLARNAMAGHLMRQGDCDKCCCYEAGSDIETTPIRPRSKQG